MTVEIYILIILSYLIGAIPTAVWLGRIFYGKDIRNHGSKNAGATNTFRVLGTKPGIFVLLVDISKGILPLIIIDNLSLTLETSSIILLKIGVGIVAVLGHIFPIYAGFKGGKGVATTLGVVITLSPIAAAISVGVFVLTLVISKIVSLSSIFAALSFFLSTVFIIDNNDFIKIFAGAVFVLITLKHIENIKRILKNEEPKVNF